MSTVRSGPTEAASNAARASGLDVEVKPENVAANYQYWRDAGSGWGAEYESRKTRLILYHIQELMLTEYVAQHAAAAAAEGRTFRVLEFGCGPGRHLRNLREIPNTDVRGFDQSRAMAEGCLRWASPEWFQSHVTIGSPTGALPFDDAEFDLVYSAEVLVHVRPEHLENRLTEIMRLSRGHVLHLEPSPDTAVESECHNGCWSHDLPEAYRRLGRECETLLRGYKVHTPFRVTVQRAPVFTWSPHQLAMYRRMESDIDAGFTVLERRATEIGESVIAGSRLASESAVLRAKVIELERRISEQPREIEALRGAIGAREAEIRVLAADLVHIREELAKAAAASIAAGATLTESQALAAKNEQIVKVREAELAQVRGALAAYRAEVDLLRERTAQFGSRLDEARRSATEGAESVRRALAREVQAAVGRCADLQDRLAVAATDLSSMRQRHEALRAGVVRR